MRAAKADSLKRDKKEKLAETQSKIWGLINEEMVSNNYISDTEDYSTILESKSERQESSHKFLPAKNCNGLAVFDGKNPVSFDIFGNRKAYQYYFNLLAGNAISLIHNDARIDSMKEAEAFYRLDEFLDEFESKLGGPVEGANGEIGEFRWSGDQDHPGFQLNFEKQLVHMAGFSG
jgi:hypothetical protein